MSANIDDIRAKKVLDRDVQLRALRAQNQKLLGQIDKLRIQVGEQREVAAVIRNAIEAAESFPRVPYKNPAKPGSPVEAVCEIGDTHTGAIVKANEVEGVNAYNRTIQNRRMDYFVEKFLGWVTTQRHGYRIDRLRVFGLADMISGNIHKELEITNEVPSPVQAVDAGLLLGETLLRLTAHFAEVEYDGVSVDNHSRLSKKYQFGDAALNSWQYVVHAVAKAYTRNAPNLKFTTADGIKHVTTVARHRFLMEHGHTVKAWSGLPIYGMQRMRGRESVRRMRWNLEEWRREKDATRREYGFDYWCLGHFHVAGWFEEDIVMNGSMMGTTSHDHAWGRFAHPSQNAFLVHPRHGVFNFVPFRLE